MKECCIVVNHNNEYTWRAIDRVTSFSLCSVSKAAFLEKNREIHDRDVILCNDEA